MTEKIRIIAYQPQYLEEHVELGRKLTSSWKYFGQTSLPVMRQQYNRPEFNPDTRLYAIDEETGKLIGIHTADVIDKDFARVEFPIVDEENYPELVDTMYKHQIEILRAKGVTQIQSRASRFWGKTEEYVKQYEYSHDRDLYFVCSNNPSQFLYDQFRSVEPVELTPYTSTYQQQIKQILIDWFDTSADLAQSYVENYEKTTAMKLNHHLVDENGIIVARATLATFESKNKVVALVTLYIAEKRSDLFPGVLTFFDRELEERKILFDQMECYISGLSKQVLQEYMLMDSVYPALSFWKKMIIV